MSVVNFPAGLVPSSWDKQKGMPDKPVGILESLKTMKQRYDAIDLGLLDVGKLKTADDARARAEALRGDVEKKIKSASDHARLLGALARKCEAEYKKNPQAPKSAPIAAANVAKAADELAGDLLAMLQSARGELAAVLSKLEAQDKKSDKSDKDGETDEADLKFVRNRVLTAIRSVKANNPDAKPIQFMLGVGKACLPYLHVSVSASHRTMLARLMGESGLKFFQGECVWEQKAYTFVGSTIPTGGFAKRLQHGLLDLTGIRYAVRVRRDTGEVDEAAGDEGGAAAPKPEGDPGKLFNERLSALLPKLKESIAEGGTKAQAIKDVVGEAGKLAAQHDYAKAHATLDQARALSAQVSARPTLPMWTEAKDLVGDQLSKLQEVFRATGNPLAIEIADRGLHALTVRLQVRLQAALMGFDTALADKRPQAAARLLAATAEMKQFLATDPVLPKLEANPFGILLTIRSTLDTALTAVERVVSG